MALGKGIPVINGFDLNSKLPLDSRTVANTMEEMNTLVTNGSVGDGQLCYCKADKKLYVLKDNVWSEVGGGGSGGSIPVVEGTTAELTEDEQNNGAIAKWTIPTAQSNNFILHTDYDGWYFMSYSQGMYSCNFIIPGDVNHILLGVETFIYLMDNTVSTNTIPYCLIADFSNGDHYDSSFVMPTGVVVVFTDGGFKSLIGVINTQGDVVSYICSEYTVAVENGLYKYKWLAYKITKSNKGYNVETTDMSAVLDENITFLPNYSSKDNGKILAIKSGGPEWIDSSSASKAISLFGRHSILVPLNSEDSSINLFRHDITSVNGNNRLLIQIYSSNNLSVKSIGDLRTLLGGVYRKIIASGIYENSPIFMVDWKGNTSSVFYTVANPTTGVPLSTFATLEDTVTTV